MTASTQAHIEVPAPGTEHEESAFGLGPPGWVALSMIVVLLIALWKGVPRMIGATLDKRIADIRKQLDEAAALRAEAEAIRADMKQKAERAHAEAEAIVKGAQEEATQLVAKAKRDAEELIGRRQKMAEDKIAAAERVAVADVRARAATAAAGAAAAIIAQKHDPKADAALIDRTIGALS